MTVHHININAENWERLRDFYVNTFDAEELQPRRAASGDWFEKVTGMKGADVRGCHVRMPDGFILEILTHKIESITQKKPFNATGFGHIALVVNDTEETLERILKNGGSTDGEVASKFYESTGKTLTMVYARDPEGNLMEIMQWD